MSTYKLSNLIRARFPMIYITTFEEDRVTKYIKSVIKEKFDDMSQLNLESIKIALEYASLCSERIERNKRRIERQEKKLENLKKDNTLYSVAEEYDIKEVIKKCKINIDKKKKELKQQLDFVSKQYNL